MILQLLILAALQDQSKDDLPEPKKITLSLTNAPLKAAADRLAKDGGHPINLGACDPKAKVSVKVDKVPFILALDALCRSAGIGYKWAGPTVELVAKPEDPLPAAAAVAQLGPFSMRAWAGPWDKDTPAVYIDTDWDPAVGAAWYILWPDMLLDEKGGRVSLSPKGAERFGSGLVTHDNKMTALSRRDGDWKRDFFPYIAPVDGAPKLKSISGTAVFAFPAGKKKTVRFDSPVEGMKKVVDGFPITLFDFGYDSAQKVWRNHISVEVAEAPQEKKLALYGLFASQRVRFFGKNGTSIPNETLGGTGSGGGANDLRDFHIGGWCRVPDGAPLSAVEVDFWSDVTLKKYPFEIKDLPEVKAKK